MAHLAQRIREKIALTVDGLPLTQRNVFVALPDGEPLSGAHLPALIVRTGAESAEMLTLAFPSVVLCRLEASIEIVAREHVLVQDTLDTILVQVTGALNASAAAFTLNGLAAGGITYQGHDGFEVEASGESPTARLITRWSVTYQYAANDPETAL